MKFSAFESGLIYYQVYLQPMMIGMVLLYLLFLVYFATLTLTSIYLGLNYYRIRDKRKVYPELITFMLPFLINFFLAQTLFDDISAFLSTLLPCIVIYLIGRRLKNVRIIGLTGGIACGKSTLVQLMENNINIDIIDCDEISRILSARGNKGYQVITKLLGDSKQEYLNPYTKQLDRQKFSNYVFGNQSFRKKFTPVVGRYIFLQILKKVASNIIHKKNLMLIDAPILYQTKILQHICYPIIVVGCSQQGQMERLKSRNRYSDEEALSRIGSQMPLSIKKKKSNIYLQNDGTKEQLIADCLGKLTRYLQKNRIGKK